MTSPDPLSVAALSDTVAADWVGVVDLGDGVLLDTHVDPPTAALLAPGGVNVATRPGDVAAAFATTATPTAVALAVALDRIYLTDPAMVRPGPHHVSVTAATARVFVGARPVTAVRTAGG